MNKKREDKGGKMRKVCTDAEIQEIIKKNKMAVVYFTGMDCGACEAIKFKIESILRSFPQINGCEINGENDLVISAKYGVFSLPIFLLYIEGKETIRIGRNVDLLDLEKNIKRYYEMIFL